MQDDLFLGALTVKETLFFRSKLVLGANATRKEIDLRIEVIFTFSFFLFLSSFLLFLSFFLSQLNNSRKKK